MLLFCLVFDGFVEGQYSEEKPFLGQIDTAESMELQTDVALLSASNPVCIGRLFIFHFTK